ncbi:MAG TPA: chemotaxis protein CheB [Ohtaekwangia sp.]|nr:chemotaxis protein CheB [Ohtaekwangia sp.]
MNNGDNHRKFDLIIMGGSAGSLSVVLKIISHFPKTMTVPLILVFHRKQSEDNVLLDVMKSRTHYRVCEIEDKDVIKPGIIYLAPPDYHILVEKNRSLTLDDSEKINFSRPSIDVTFESASDVFGESLMCILLSGANADGAEGLLAARTAGAFTVVQDPADAEIGYMPEQALLLAAPDLVLNDKNIGKLIDLLTD